jgi:hypothetical protein
MDSMCKLGRILRMLLTANRYPVHPHQCTTLRQAAFPTLLNPRNGMQAFLVSIQRQLKTYFAGHGFVPQYFNRFIRGM